jgi:hypothetical protein
VIEISDAREEIDRPFQLTMHPNHSPFNGSHQGKKKERKSERKVIRVTSVTMP